MDCIDSTNTFLLDDRQPPNQLCSAEHQTQGRGRRGQTWADSGDSALFSISGAFPPGLDLSAWPIQVAITLADSLNRLIAHAKADKTPQPGVKIKWPNDLYCNHHGQWGKCGGILVESRIGRQGKIVTGIGLNSAPLRGITIDSDYPITHLPTLLQRCVADKKQLIVILTNRLWQAWQVFIQQPNVKVKHYQTLDYLYGKSLSATDTYNQCVTHGIGAGINAHGHLLLQTPTGTVALSSQQRIRLNPDSINK